MLEINKIYNVDTYKAIKDIDDKSIDLIYTDIPYLVPGFHYDKREYKSDLANRKTKQLNNIESIVSGIDYSLLDEFVRVLKNINIFIWCSNNQIYDIIKYFKEKHKVSYTILFWGKTNPIPSNCSFLSDVEYCLHFKRGGVRYNESYFLKSRFYTSATNQIDKKLYDHPTIKPYDLVERHILLSTKENALVLDPFSGSGTTALACKNNNRRYIAFEIDKSYYKKSIERLSGISQEDKRKHYQQLSLL